MQGKPPTVSDLVLIGGGHAHVHLLKMMGMPALRETLWQSGIRVTLITTGKHTPYSGMLPGYVAGHYTATQIHLDLQKLCRFSGTRLIHAAACKITYNTGGSNSGGMVYCADGRPPIRYDCLSLDIGSAPAAGDQVYQQGVIPVKPIANFCARYQELQAKWQTMLANDKNDAKEYCLAVVGGGAGGIELALSIQYNFQQQQQQTTAHVKLLRVILVTSGAELLKGHNPKVRRIFQRVLKERNIQVHYNSPVTAVEQLNGRKLLVVGTNAGTAAISPDSADPIVVDDCIWCVTAGVSSWLETETPLATTSSGFVRVNDTYECIHHPGVFAAGDCCHMDKHPRPKAGVFAVRAGPILTENLVNYLLRKPLRSHRPQQDFLGLIMTGDKYAIASKGSWFAMEGRWFWWWKDWIDRKWMAKYTTELPDLEQMMSKMDFRRNTNSKSNEYIRSKGEDVFEAFSADPMRCGGCGAKVGSTTVSRVLGQVHQRQVIRAKELGLDPPPPIDHDDAAVMPLPQTNGNGAGVLIQTIDYFRELVSDPYIFGKIVAVHALSDVHAMGAIAVSALTLAVAPFAADEAVTESTLLHLLSGVSDVLQEEGVRLVGGHTCEGLELACGLSVQGFAENPDRLLRKRGGKIGDKLVLTKPIGSGALFAADMRAQCKGEFVTEAIASLVKSNVVASKVAITFQGVHSCTDVTGFGLVGHLLEMLMANEGDSQLESTGALIFIRDIPFLQGGLEASSKQIYSSLQSQNARNRRAVSNHSAAAKTYPVEYPLLFDPQTAGGLLFFVDPSECDAFVSRLQQENVAATVIGELEHLQQQKQEAIPLANGGEDVCTIGSGDAITGKRIRIAL